MLNVDASTGWVAEVVGLNTLAVTGGSGNVSVASGVALVNGCVYVNDASLTVAVSTPASATRIDRIILRFTASTTQTVRAVRLAGTEGGGAPTLTQNSTTYEVPLAQISTTTGGTITVTADQRAFIRSSGLRGATDASTIEWDTTNKYLKIKDGGVTGTQLNQTVINYPGQFSLTKTSGGASAAVLVSAANPFISVASTTGSADTKSWDAGTLASDNSFVIRAVNDANTVATQAVQITRSTTTISAINLKAPTNVTGAFAATGGISGTTGSFSSTLAAGATTITGTISATNASVAGVINAGSTTISGTMTSNNASVAGLTATGTLTASGAATITGALASGTHTVTGNITASGQTAGATGAITGLLTAGSITTSGTMTANNASVTGLVASATMTASTSVTSPSFVGALTGNADTATTVANDAITNAKLANMAVNAIKGRITSGTGDPEDLSAANVATILASTGNAVLTSRMGGSASVWSTAGATTYTAGSTKLLVGVTAITFSGGFAGTGSVTFPASYFSAAPHVTASIIDKKIGSVTNATQVIGVDTASVTASGMTINAACSATLTGAIDISWTAYGPA